ncbi:hypothetical protein [Gloeothece verrucosa]|uniref:Uncharacterized protein n=1 Tax=Gloeothece verrucosa (strain PCC 7822) TaxID=497965 RepID=E0UJ80_GLOV7|nr:hypothetical protein [Gloeothece verrucosa]ADN15783.1 hypothetical protein Cyan7822_3851 [Gloeothece verrucosa PCC 7822]
MQTLCSGAGIWEISADIPIYSPPKIKFNWNDGTEQETIQGDNYLVEEKNKYYNDFTYVVNLTVRVVWQRYQGSSLISAFEWAADYEKTITGIPLYGVGSNFENVPGGYSFWGFNRGLLFYENPSGQAQSINAGSSDYACSNAGGLFDALDLSIPHKGHILCSQNEFILRNSLRMISGSWCLGSNTQTAILAKCSGVVINSVRKVNSQTLEKEYTLKILNSNQIVYQQAKITNPTVEKISQKCEFKENYQSIYSEINTEPNAFLVSETNGNNILIKRCVGSIQNNQIVSSCSQVASVSGNCAAPKIKASQEPLCPPGTCPLKCGDCLCCYNEYGYSVKSYCGGTEV